MWTMRESSVKSQGKYYFSWTNLHLQHLHYTAEVYEKCVPSHPFYLCSGQKFRALRYWIWLDEVFVVQRLSRERSEFYCSFWRLPRIYIVKSKVRGFPGILEISQQLLENDHNVLQSCFLNNTKRIFTIGTLNVWYIYVSLPWLHMATSLILMICLYTQWLLTVPCKATLLKARPRFLMIVLIFATTYEDIVKYPIINIKFTYLICLVLLCKGIFLYLSKV